MSSAAQSRATASRQAPVFTVTIEADIYPLQAPDLADKIDGAIEEGSQFHETHGYYEQRAGTETAKLPEGWINRVHRVQYQNTRGRVRYCLDLVDLFLSKAVAGRDKDRLFCMALSDHGYVTSDTALEHAPQMPIDNLTRRALRATIRRWAKSAGGARG